MSTTSVEQDQPAADSWMTDPIALDFNSRVKELVEQWEAEGGDPTHRAVIAIKLLRPRLFAEMSALLEGVED